MLVPEVWYNQSVLENGLPVSTFPLGVTGPTVHCVGLEGGKLSWAGRLDESEDKEYTSRSSLGELMTSSGEARVEGTGLCTLRHVGAGHQGSDPTLADLRIRFPWFGPDSALALGLLLLVPWLPGPTENE